MHALKQIKIMSQLIIFVCLTTSLYKKKDKLTIKYSALCSFKPSRGGPSLRSTSPYRVKDDATNFVPGHEDRYLQYGWANEAVSLFFKIS
jgi:hypothetical protein